MKTSLRMLFSGVVLLTGSLVAQELNRPTVQPPSLPAPPVPGTIPVPPRPAPRAVQPNGPIPPTLTPAVSPSSTVSVRPVQPGSLPAIPPQPFTPQPTAVYQPPTVLTALSWDASEKEYTSKPGEISAPFTFWLTNTSPTDVSITSVRTSCGCTVAKLPSTPWVIAPGKGGPIEVTVNLAGKSGLITKAVTVESPSGTTNLLVKVNIGGTKPSATNPIVMNDADRLKNMQLALADRQVIFKNQDCTKCHSDPAKGIADGHQLYTGVCGVCHDSHIRASMVPDLRALTTPADAEYWRNWITYGRAGSMMPAFAQSEGGPLSEAQVEALVKYMVVAYPARQPGRRSAAVLQPRPAPSVVSPVVAVPQ